MEKKNPYCFQGVVKVTEPYFRDTTSCIPPEWRLGWGLLVISQKIKCLFFILPRNLLQTLFQASR